MISLLATVVMTSTSFISPNYSQTDLPDNNFVEALEEFQDEIHKGPTHPDFLACLEGGIMATAPFAASLGEEIENIYAKFAIDFASYKDRPNLSLIEKIEDDMLALRGALKTLSSPLPFKQPMAASLERFSAEVQNPLPISKEAFNYLQGEEYVLWMLASEISAQFDDAFDKLDDDFEYFIEKPNDETQKIVLSDIEALQALLKD